MTPEVREAAEALHRLIPPDSGGDLDFTAVEIDVCQILLYLMNTDLDQSFCASSPAVARALARLLEVAAATVRRWTPPEKPREEAVPVKALGQCYQMPMGPSTEEGE